MQRAWKNEKLMPRIDFNRLLHELIQEGVCSKQELSRKVTALRPDLRNVAYWVGVWCAEFGVAKRNRFGGPQEPLAVGVRRPGYRGHLTFNWELADEGLTAFLNNSVVSRPVQLCDWAKGALLTLSGVEAEAWLEANKFEFIDGRYRKFYG